MNTEGRKYNYIGELTIKRSRVLKEENLPRDDTLHWLFLIIGERRFTFFYKIEESSEAAYGMPFPIQMSFIMDEIKSVIKINNTYEVWRAEEPVGTVKIINVLE